MKMDKRMSLNNRWVSHNETLNLTLKRNGNLLTFYTLNIKREATQMIKGNLYINDNTFYK